MQKRWFDRYFTAIKVVIMLCAYGYLTYMLATFKMYQEFAESLRHLSFTRIGCLATVFLLVLANWGLEGLKWHKLLAHLEPTPFIKATKQVLIGLTAGFFTPNRIGEPIGRCMLLPEGKRSQGVALMMVGVMGQTFASLVYGVVACTGFLSLYHTTSMPMDMWLTFGGVLLAMLSLVYFTLPSWGKCLITGKLSSFWQFMYDIRSGLLRLSCITDWLKSLIPYLKAALSVSYGTLLKVTLYSLLRYGVYCLQYFLMLRFFDIQIDTLTALLIIPINYLAVSATPSIAFAEMGIRGSLAIMFLGSFTQNTVGVALAAIGIWFINYVMPMLLGSVLLWREKR
ncbi:MAG: lysylphosphatidylglycerol synthase transmembrane domain-containing protein [Paludibacteraceae bacterium]|nr:lysylphosphatidylglycerol synthase transmembrane domain-containing protein [Paludibacteraceae bacterium]